MKPNLNHQPIRVPGDPRVCRLCGSHFAEGIEGVCPSRVVRFAAPRLFEDELGPDEGWVELDELRYGAVFETKDGIRAVKSVSSYDPPLGTVLETQCLCILLASGEFAHFPEKNETLVREVLVP